ncbi:MAG: type II secretion system secretin GspD [Mariprofundus sp.]|nr:type II secretion system secretin GspD [Mariprofundus sp.]
MKPKHIVIALYFSLFFSAPLALAKDITLNFKNADIRAFIEFVAGFSGKNFLVDNRVKGKVTIVSPTPISEAHAYEVFLSVLEVNGFATVPGIAVTKIVPRAESKQKALPLRLTQGTADDSMVTQVIKLRYADAQQLVALIRPLISPNSHLVAYPRGNMLLLTDSASNIQRIQRIMNLLDRKDAVGVQLFTLKHASADKLASTLTTLYTATPGSQKGSVKALAHQPGNMLIIVAAPQIINEVAGVIERLDIAPESDSGRLQVRYLKHANAENIAKVINELVGGQSASATAPGQTKPLFSGDVKVVADIGTNALLITADPSDIKAVGRIIDRLDIRRRQVLVEALIVEIRGNAIERFGVEWMGAGGIGAGVQSFQNLKPIGASLSANATAATPVSTSLALAAAAPSGLTLGVINQALSIGALLHALQSDIDANVLSTPNLLTMDNEEAEIVVGQNVPFITGTNATQGGLANPFQTIERKDVGLTLRVKPQISAGDTVRLEIFQEISTVDGGTAAEGGIITNKRSIKTVVLANDGQMIVLGGLMQDDKSITVQKVPCIGAIPIIGEPFKFTENKITKTNLMVFLKPTIIKNATQIEEITDQKYIDIKKLYERPLGGGTILFPQINKDLPEHLKPTPQYNAEPAPQAPVQTAP